MRVTHVITRLIVGGAQENTVATVLGLQEIPGVQVNLISGPSIGPEGSLEDEFSAHPGILQTLPTLVRPIHPWQDVLAYQKLTRIFRNKTPDIVHTHSGKAGVLGRLAAAKAKVPVIIHTIHGPSFGPFQGHLANLILCQAELRAGRVTTHFVTVANAMRDQYLAAGIGHPEQYTRIFSGFSLEPLLQAKNDLTLRARYRIAPDDIVIGKIARLFKLKGHDDLFAVAPQLIRTNPKLKFLLVGDGAWRSRFEQMAQDSGYQNHFVFTGLIPPSEIPAHVGIMDGLVHLSAREGLARALPMALAAGKPVIAYDCDGAREVCIDGKTGFLIRPGHHRLLMERLNLLVENPTLRTELAANGRVFVEENFAVARMVSQQHALYSRLLPATRPGKV